MRHIQTPVIKTLGIIYNASDITNEMHDFHCSLQKMDKNRDGVVTLDEFILSCQEVFIMQSYNSVKFIFNVVIFNFFTAILTYTRYIIIG